MSDVLPDPPQRDLRLRPGSSTCQVKLQTSKLDKVSNDAFLRASTSNTPCRGLPVLPNS